VNEDLVPVFVANGQVHAHQVKAFLEASGVRCALRGESLTQTHGLTLDGLGSVEVLVTEADEARALGLLDSADRGQLRLADDADVEATPPEIPGSPGESSRDDTD
jgi:hypothetical protein